MRRFACAFLISLVAAPVAAQTTTPPARGLPANLRDGRWAMDFRLSNAAAGAGFWTLVSRRDALGLDVSGSFDLFTRTYETDAGVVEQSNEQLFVAVEPFYRRYMAGRGSVASFLQVGPLVTVEGSAREVDGETSSYWRTSFGGQLGMGLQWFPSDNFAVGTQLGVRGSYYRFEDESPTNPMVEERLSIGISQPLIRFSILF